MNEQTFTIIKLVLELLIVLIIYYIAPVIKAWLQHKQVYSFCEEAVRTAAQKLPDNPQWNSAKLQYATTMVQQLCKKFNIQITEEQIKDLIESSYNIYKESKKEGGDNTKGQI